MASTPSRKGAQEVEACCQSRVLTLTPIFTTNISYDPLGRLHQVAASATTQFLYDGDKLSVEYDGSGALLRRYVHGAGTDEPLVWYEGSALTMRNWLHTDNQGSIIATTDGSGAASIYVYGPYGEPQGGSWTGSRFRYTGQIAIPEVALYYYKARFYDPVLGRFLQTDPIGYKDDLDLYSYVKDDPLDLTDPTGNCEAHDDKTKALCDKLSKDPRSKQLIEPVKGTSVTSKKADEIEAQAGFDENGDYGMDATDYVLTQISAVDAVKVGKASIDAQSEAEGKFGKGNTHNNAGDAFKHTLWQIKLVRAVGVAEAKGVGDAHERAPNNPRRERLQDLMNNNNARVLAQIFPDMSPEELAETALSAGLLQDHPLDVKD